jgi:hypothetical protein
LFLGSASATGCFQNAEPTLIITPVGSGRHDVSVETPHWEKYSDDLSEDINLVYQDKDLANERAAALCNGPYAIEVIERRIQPCDWVCEGHPPFYTSTTWSVSCKSTS